MTSTNVSIMQTSAIITHNAKIMLVVGIVNVSEVIRAMDSSVRIWMSVHLETANSTTVGKFYNKFYNNRPIFQINPLAPNVSLVALNVGFDSFSLIFYMCGGDPTLSLERGS